MKRRKFLIVAVGSGGITASYPMKDWLREHPGHLPAGIDPGEHSHYIRDLLVQAGWRAEASTDEVRLYAPGTVPAPVNVGRTDSPPAPSAQFPAVPAPAVVPTGAGISRLQTVKLVVEIIAGVVAVIAAISALVLRSN